MKDMQVFFLLFMYKYKIIYHMQKYQHLNNIQLYMFTKETDETELLCSYFFTCISKHGKWHVNITCCVQVNGCGMYWHFEL